VQQARRCHRHEARAGEAISAVILGGSIDIGADLDTTHDAYFVRPQRADQSAVGRGASATGGAGCASRRADARARAQAHVSDWIAQTFPPADGSQHKFFNGARASTGSPYFARRARLAGRRRRAGMQLARPLC